MSSFKWKTGVSRAQTFHTSYRPSEYRCRTSGNVEICNINIPVFTIPYKYIRF